MSNTHSTSRPIAEKLVFRRGVTLALGGGFARSCSQLGVLQVFEENAIPVACLAATSTGSILAAAYAAGLPLSQIVEKCREVRYRDLVPWSIPRAEMASGERCAALLEKLFGELQFDALAIPTLLVATDLETGEPVVFKEGRLAPAISASCAFPGLLEPLQIGTRFLADGALLAPVPTQVAHEFGAPNVIAVSVPLHDQRIDDPSNFFQVVSHAVRAAHKNQNDSWERHASIVLHPEVQDIAWDEFHRVDEAVLAGAEAARRALPQIHKLLTIQPPLSEFGKQGELLLAGALQ